MEKIDYNINSGQAHILALLSEREMLTLSQLQAITGFSRSALQIYQFDMRERCFISNIRPGHHRCMQLVINQTGKDALRIYQQRHSVEKTSYANQNRISWITQPEYVPPEVGFVRNDGNAKYRSLGAFGA